MVEKLGPKGPVLIVVVALLAVAAVATMYFKDSFTPQPTIEAKPWKPSWTPPTAAGGAGATAPGAPRNGPGAPGTSGANRGETKG